jgi:REP element-mobilizing transposase RayT
MKTIGQTLQHRRRERLPHWEKGGACYFLTFSARRGEHFDSEERAMVLASCRFGHPERWILHAAVVMPDHVHMLLTPQEIKVDANVDAGAGTRTNHDKNKIQEKNSQEPRWWSLAEIVKSIKSVTARKINQHRGRKGGSIWQDEYYDHVIRDQADFAAELNYLLQNPIKQGLAQQPHDWDGLWVNQSS